MVLNNVILSTPIVCIVLVVINIFIILHGHTMKEEESFYQQIGLKFEEETSEVLRLEHSSVWCGNLDAPSNRSETPGMF